MSRVAQCFVTSTAVLSCIKNKQTKKRKLKGTCSLGSRSAAGCAVARPVSLFPWRKVKNNNNKKNHSSTKTSPMPCWFYRSEFLLGLPHSLVSCSSPSWAPSSLASFSSLLRLFFLCLWRRWLSPSSLSCCFLSRGQRGQRDIRHSPDTAGTQTWVWGFDPATGATSAAPKSFCDISALSHCHCNTLPLSHSHYHTATFCHCHTLPLLAVSTGNIYLGVLPLPSELQQF